MGTVGILNYLPLPVWVLLGSLITCSCQYEYCWAPQLLAAGSMGTAGLLNYLPLAVWVLGSGRLLKLYLDLSVA